MMIHQTDPGTRVRMTSWRWSGGRASLDFKVSSSWLWHGIFRCAGCFEGIAWPTRLRMAGRSITFIVYSNALVKCDRCVDTFMTLHVFGPAVATCWQRVFLVELKRNLGPIAASGFIFGVVSPSSVAAWKVRGWLIHVDPNLIDIFFMGSTLHINDRHRLLYKLLFSILMYIYIHKFAGQDS